MLGWVAETTVVAAVLTLAALGLTWLGSARLGPAVRHALWLTVLVRLLLPPIVTAPWAIPVRPAKVEPAGPSPREASGPAVSPDPLIRRLLSLEMTPGTGDLTRTDVATERGRAGEVSTHVNGSQVTPSAPRQWPFRAVLLGLWGATTVALGLAQLWRVTRFARRLRHAVPVPEGLASDVRELAGRLRVRAPEVLAVAGLGVPVVWCLGRPKLLIPAHLIGALSADRWRGVLAHELAHLRRGDHWVRRLSLVVGLLWWWNPVYWVARRRLDAEAELACDAWVVAVLPDDRRTYAATMLEICEALAASRPGVAAPPALAPAFGGRAAGRFFERRLLMILNDRVPCRLTWRGLLAPALLGVLAAPAWTSAAPSVAGDEPAAKAAPDGTAADLLAQLTRRRAESRLKWAQAMLDKGYVSQDQVDEEKIKLVQAVAAQEEQVRKKAVDEAAAARRAIEDAKREMAKVAEEVKGARSLAAQKSDLEKAKADLDKARDQLKKAEADAARAQEAARDKALKAEERARDAARSAREPRQERRREREDRRRERPEGKDKEGEKPGADVEIDIPDLPKLFAPDSELIKGLQTLGPELQKRIQEKLGPGTEFDEKMRDLGVKIGDELKKNLGPGSDFDKAMKEMAAALEEQFGPGSAFEKWMKELAEEVDAKVKEKHAEKPREEARPRAEAKRETEKARAQTERGELQNRARDRRARALEAQIKALSKELERLKNESASPGEKDKLEKF